MPQNYEEYLNQPNKTKKNYLVLRIITTKLNKTIFFLDSVRIELNQV